MYLYLCVEEKDKYEGQYGDKLLINLIEIIEKLLYFVTMIWQNQDWHWHNTMIYKKLELVQLL